VPRYKQDNTSSIVSKVKFREYSLPLDSNFHNCTVDLQTSFPSRGIIDTLRFQSTLNNYGPFIAIDDVIFSNQTTGKTAMAPAMPTSTPTSTPTSAPTSAPTAAPTSAAASTSVPSSVATTASTPYSSSVRSNMPIDSSQVPIIALAATGDMKNNIIIGVCVSFGTLILIGIGAAAFFFIVRRRNSNLEIVESRQTTTIALDDTYSGWAPITKVEIKERYVKFLSYLLEDWVADTLEMSLEVQDFVLLVTF
jgi:hypothetical protein